MFDTPFYGRQRELSLLNEFLEEPGFGLAHIRGRRRIGKSLLLQKLQSEHPNQVFYFQGDDDATTSVLISKFIQKWDTFTTKPRLSKARSRSLKWFEVFEEVASFVRSSEHSVILIFDEIQWIAKKGVGFTGQLKEAIGNWKRSGQIKVILSGSSNKFFSEKTGGETKILRGLRTFADIWVYPFSLSEVQKYYFPNWNQEQNCVLYMITGGVPYYLEQIKNKENFIRSINYYFFTRKTIFLNEVDEILDLEFNENSKENVKTMLDNIPIQGATLENIIRRTKLSNSTVRDIVNKLENYKILTLRKKIPHSLKSEIKYYMKDFYLNFYFKVLRKYSQVILANINKNIFGTEILASKVGYFIPDFSGQAFELLVQGVLENGIHTNFSEPLFKKLGILEPGYEVGTFWEEGKVQIDIVVKHPIDREVRLIETKWIAKTGVLTEADISGVKDKYYLVPPGYSLSHYLMLSKPLSPELSRSAERQKIRILYMEDLFVKNL